MCVFFFAACTTNEIEERERKKRIDKHLLFENQILIIREIVVFPAVPGRMVGWQKLKEIVVSMG